MHQERHLFYYQTEVMDNDLPAVATGLMLTSNYHQLCQLALQKQRNKERVIKHAPYALYSVNFKVIIH